MDNLIKDGEQALDGGNSNQDQSNNQGNNQGNNQQQSSNNSSGGGFVSNTEDAYINNEANSFMTKEGLPTAADGVVDGALDTEVNKYKKDF